MKAITATSTYTGALRQFNADATAQVEFVLGAPQTLAYGCNISVNVGTGDVARVGASLDSTSAASTHDALADIVPTSSQAGRVAPMTARAVAAGYHYIALTHGTTGGSGSPIFTNPRVTAEVWA